MPPVTPSVEISPALLVLPPTLDYGSIIPTFISTYSPTGLFYIAVTPATHTAPRRATFSSTASLLSSVLAHIHSSSPASTLDPRVVFLSPTSTSTTGPVVSPQTLAKLQPWACVYSAYPDGADPMSQQVPAIIRVPFPIPITQPPDEDGATLAEEDPAVVAVGGTFDHLHLGHKLLLTMTAYLLTSSTATAIPRRIVIGVSGPALLQKKAYAEFLEPWEVRVERTRAFLKGLLGRDDVVLDFAELEEPCGPTITDKEIQTLVVTEETKGGGEYVNAEREKKGLGRLEVKVVGLIEELGEGAEKISSTEYRRREAEASLLQGPSGYSVT